MLKSQQMISSNKNDDKDDMLDTISSYEYDVSYEEPDRGGEFDSLMNSDMLD